MPAAGKHVLTTQHKLMGNLVPLAVLVVVAGLGAVLISRSRSDMLGWFLLLSSPVLTWMTVNFVGLWDNRRLRAQVDFRLMTLRPRSLDRKYFVGFARPAYRSVLDPHEDVGFLIFHEDRLEFFGGELHFTLFRDDYADVVRRTNPHTLLGLGGWVSIEGRVEGQPVRMYIEPREDFSLIGNRRWARFLELEVRKWAKSRALIPAQTLDTPADGPENPPISKLVRSGTRLL
jgi:hypothetical protein